MDHAFPAQIAYYALYGVRSIPPGIVWLKPFHHNVLQVPTGPSDEGQEGKVWMFGFSPQNLRGSSPARDVDEFWPPGWPSAAGGDGREKIARNRVGCDAIGLDRMGCDAVACNRLQPGVGTAYGPIPSGYIHTESCTARTSAMRPLRPARLNCSGRDGGQLSQWYYIIFFFFFKGLGGRMFPPISQPTGQMSKCVALHKCQPIDFAGESPWLAALPRNLQPAAPATSGCARSHGVRQSVAGWPIASREREAYVSGCDDEPMETDMTKKWTIYVNRKFSGVGWGFDTFAKAVQYGRDQRAAEIARHGTDKDFWVSFIDGPGGRMDYETVLPLFQ